MSLETERKEKTSDGEQGQTPPHLQKNATSWDDKLKNLITKIAYGIKNQKIPSGDVAALRRMVPEDPSCAAFWKIVAFYLLGEIPEKEPARSASELRWAVLLSAMTQMDDSHLAGHRLGNVLAEAGFSELRFTRILQAREQQLFSSIRTMARFLASKGQSVDWTDVARLLFYSEQEASERTRRNIARDYYSTLQSLQNQS